MTKLGDNFVKFCEKVNTIPAESLCVLIFLLQAASLDYFLVKNLSYIHLTWIVSDAVNLVLLISCIYISYCTLDKEQTHQKNDYNIAWLSWLSMNAIVAAKTIVLFNEIAEDIEEEDPSFFGPNTLKTTIALGSCIFALLLITQHNAALGSERRQYIEELTGTVVFDLLDTVDILEILFDGDKTDDFWDGLREFILAVAALNLLIPTVPLLILSKTRFGYARLQRHLVYAHRLLLVLAVNVPNLLVRFIVWHGFSGAISPFSLKNIILICMTFYEFYLHKREKYEDHLRERMTTVDTNDPTNQQSTVCSNFNGAANIKSVNEKHYEEGFGIESRIETHV